ncbi:MAG: amidase domain-containing protein [Oscillospiraceae bacterium]|jgi:hypothetical protein|nr:amidase domain-containing protein [Oscillospiraceae bacterium]
MMKFKEYNRDRAVEYAHKWAFGRNSAYYNFDGMGGDCTNFVSQCIYAGGAVMNYVPDLGWFYVSSKKRSAAWSGVQYLYNFLTKNKSVGPYGHEAPISETHIGDVIQLRFDKDSYTHSLFVVKVGEEPSENNIYISCHTMDSDNRPLNSYDYTSHRLIHIDGINV